MQKQAAGTLAILRYPDPRLAARAAPVARFDSTLATLIDSMIDTLRASGGIGLAAPQVGHPLRLFVADVSEGAADPLVFVNPSIVARGAPGFCEESCLSVPGLVGVVPRALAVRIEAQDRSGEHFAMDADGLLAACIQHEIDHLDGRLFIGRLGWLDRVRARRRLRVAQRASGSATTASSTVEQA